MKKFFIAVTVFLVILVGVIIYGASQSGKIIRDAVLHYAPSATGTAVSLDTVKVAFLGGDAGLRNLIVGNPKGFKSDYAFKIGNIAVKIDMNSLLGDVIHIEEVRIEGADLIYEIGTKGNNISKIQKNIEAYTKKIGLDTSESDTEARFIIDNIYITGTKVKLSSDLLGGKGAGLTLPDIHLKNIGTEDKAATAGEVGATIFGAVNRGLSKVVSKDMMNKAVKGVTDKIGNIFK
ncbi:MAG: hypothetical protein JKY45_00425 [Emcibacter sp.]|nr:hypothetical protein [Emcibacter sp.]